MVRRKERDTAQCPRCSEAVEDAEHVLRCKGSEAEAMWIEGMEKVKVWMQDQGTMPDIVDAIDRGTTAWYQGSTMQEDPAWNSQTKTAFANQTGIGWRAIMEGCPAIGWEEAQESYYRFIGNKKTGKRWLGLLVRKLAETAWAMWDHRNSVNTANETDMLSREVNVRIRNEYQRGWAGFDRSSLKLRMFLPTLLQKTLGYRKAWLLHIATVREHIARRQERRLPPLDVIRTGIGYVEWVRRGGWNQTEERAREE